MNCGSLFILWNAVPDIRCHGHKSLSGSMAYACLVGILGNKLLHNMPSVVFRLLQEKCYSRGNRLLEIGAWSPSKFIPVNHAW